MHLVDRRSLFEHSLFLGVSQLLVCLFAFTSLFKPAYGTVTFFTGIIWSIAFVSAWYQGFEFWTDSDRLAASGVGVAIFLFMTGCVINVYGAVVLHNLERDLVKVTNELSEHDKFLQPRGAEVVYLHADVEGSQALTRAHPAAMDAAMDLFRGLFTT